jgi:hypothetical protein
MALRDKLDETKLRSLTYGDDSPYVTVDINTQKVISDGKVLNVLNNGNRINSAIIDTYRIGNFLFDKPWWSVQQISQQVLNINSNFGYYEGKPKFSLSPNQQYTPLNTLAQIALTGVGGHIERKGLVPGDVIGNLLGNGTYEAIKKREFDLADANINPLVTFSKNLLKPTELKSTTTRSSQSKIGKFVTNAISLFTDPYEPIYKYAGGPSSLGGIGTTTIRRYYNSIDEINRSNLNGFVQQSVTANPILDTKSGGTTINYLSTLGVSYYAEDKYKNNEDKFTKSVNTNNNPYVTPTWLNQTPPEPTPNPLFNIYTTGSGYTGVTGSYIYNVNTSSLITNNETITYNNGKTSLTFKSPGKGWYGISREVRVGSGVQDGINLTPLFTTKADDSLAGSDQIKIDSNTYNIRDLVKFRIEAIQTDTLRSTWMIFRAFITDYSDQVTAEWNGTKYIGRAEKFYTYGGFDRTVNISFKVAAISATEMGPMYQKLNYLMSNMMGDYNAGIMRGPMSRMTIGNWLDRQPGVITSLTYKVANDSPWEIAMDSPEGGDNSNNQLVLPHIVEVSMTFLPIGTQHKGKNLLPQRGADQANIAQNESGIQFIKDNKIPNSFNTRFNSYNLSADVTNINYQQPKTKTDLEQAPSNGDDTDTLPTPAKTTT